MGCVGCTSYKIAVDDLEGDDEASQEEEAGANEVKVVDAPVLHFIAQLNAGKVDGDGHGQGDHEEIAADSVCQPTPPESTAV